MLLIALSAPVAAQDMSQEKKAPTIPATPRLLQHSNFFTPERVYDLQVDPYSKQHLPKDLNYKVYSAVGYNLANSIMIVGPDNGIIIVDTLGDQDSVQARVIPAFREKLGYEPGAKLPIRAIIYTHNHIDHTAGVQGYLKQADRPPCPPETVANAGQDGTFIATGQCVEIIGQKNIVDSVINTATVVGNIIDPRSVYMYGSKLLPLEGSVNEGNFTNNGIGPFIRKGTSTFQMPSRTFTNELLFAAAGVNMKLIYVPSETDDEIAVFLPDSMNHVGLPGNLKRPVGGVSKGDGWGGKGLLLSAEVIQGPSFPNLYSLRGTSYRNPAEWFRSVDKLRQFDSWCMVPSHGPPLCGQDNIQTLLLNFRDAIQFTHDQTVRHMNKGHTPPEMAAHIKLPDYLLTNLDPIQPPGIKGLPQVGETDPKNYRDPQDYLTTFYGSVPQAVREIYFGYVGWFEADPVGLSPTPPKALAAGLIRMMGGPTKKPLPPDKAMLEGRKRILEESNTAMMDGDAAWKKVQELERMMEMQGCQKYETTPPPQECIDLMKTADQQTEAAKAQWQWAAELTTLLVRVDHYDRDARSIKARAFDRLAEPQLNPNWRNWYLTAAKELRLPDDEYFPPITSALVSPEIVSALPTGAWVNSWTMRLKAEETADSKPTAPAAKPQDGVHMSLGFWFPPDQTYGGEGYELNIRRAIAEFTQTNSVESLVKEVDVAISITREALGNLLIAEAQTVNQEYNDKKDKDKVGEHQGLDPFVVALLEAIRNGQVKLLKGDVGKVQQFFSYFDQRETHSPYLTIR
jgi:alkyl sulfatase BDS1-like metallo-beta-lactamase superfamily hydrolase